MLLFTSCFAAIARLTALERLEIAETPLDDTSLIELCKALPHVRVLDVSSTEISDAGATGLARLRHLESLAMDTPGITGRALASLTGLAHLRRLDLFGAW